MMNKVFQKEIGNTPEVSMNDMIVKNEDEVYTANIAIEYSEESDSTTWGLN